MNMYRTRSDKAFKGIVVYRTCHSIVGRLFEITFTVFNENDREE